MPMAYTYDSQTVSFRKPFLVGVYSRNMKPVDLTASFAELVAELSQLIHEKISGKQYEIVVPSSVCKYTCLSNDQAGATSGVTSASSGGMDRWVRFVALKMVCAV